MIPLQCRTGRWKVFLTDLQTERSTLLLIRIPHQEFVKQTASVLTSAPAREPVTKADAYSSKPALKHICTSHPSALISTRALACKWADSTCAYTSNRYRTHRSLSHTHTHLSPWFSHLIDADWAFIYAPMHTSCQTFRFWLQTGKLGGVAVPL